MFCALLVRGDIMKTNIELISTRVYAGRLKDRENLNNSSSGGAFTALSDFFLKKGNAVDLRLSITMRTTRQNSR